MEDQACKKQPFEKQQIILHVAYMTRDQNGRRYICQLAFQEGSFSLVLERQISPENELLRTRSSSPPSLQAGRSPQSPTSANLRSFWYPPGFLPSASFLVLVLASLISQSGLRSTSSQSAFMILSRVFLRLSAYPWTQIFNSSLPAWYSCSIFGFFDTVSPDCSSAKRVLWLPSLPQIIGAKPARSNTGVLSIAPDAAPE